LGVAELGLGIGRNLRAKEATLSDATPLLVATEILNPDGSQPATSLTF
jgi:hypothetical protein